MDGNQSFFKRVGKRGVADIMQEDRDLCPFGFLLGDVYTFGADCANGLGHEVKRAKGMLEAGMLGSRVNKIGKTQLFDPAQALKPGVMDQVVNQIAGQGGESIDRIVDNLSFVHCIKNISYFVFVRFYFDGGRKGIL